MIAIETKFHGPTTHRGDRISATCCICNKRNYASYDYALDPKNNHRLVAGAHLQKHHRTLNTSGELHVRVDEGHDTRAGYVFPVVSCQPY